MFFDVMTIIGLTIILVSYFISKPKNVTEHIIFVLLVIAMIWSYSVVIKHEMAIPKRVYNK